MSYNGAIKTFDTIADLKLQGGGPNVKVNVLGYAIPGDGGGGEFYWDNTSTSADNGGTIFQVTGVTTGRWKRKFDTQVYNVKWFGAKGNYNLTTGNDDTITISSCINYLTAIKTANFKPTILFPENEGYLITSTIVIPEGIHVIIKSNIIYNGPTTSGALVIGRSGFSNDGVNLELRVRQRSIPAWTDPTVISNNFGVKIYNLINSVKCNIQSISFFCNNIVLIGDDTGGTTGPFSYNNITIGSSMDAIKHLTLLATGTNGYINENKFNTGNFTNTSSTSSRNSSRYGIYINSTNSFLANNNVFYKPCFQLGYSSISDHNLYQSIPVLIDKGGQNTFKDARSENSGNIVMITNNNSSGNYIYLTYFNLDNATQLIDNSTERNNFVVSDLISRISQSSALIFDSGFLPEKINKYDSSRYYIPGLSWSRPTDGNIYPAGSGLTLGDAYLTITSEKPGVFIDTTVAKRFAIKWDVDNQQGGRLMIRCYDAAGEVIIPITTPYLVNPNNIFTTLSSSYGNVYVTSSDNTGRYLFFAVDTSIKKIFFAVAGGTQPIRLKSFQIYSLDGYSASVTSGLDRKFGEFGMSSIIPTETKPKGTIIYNDLSVSSSPLGWQNTDGGTTWVPLNTTGNYIQNQITSAQTSSNFWISGTGRASNSFSVIKDGSATSVETLTLYNTAQTRGVNFQLNGNVNPGLTTYIHNGVTWVKRVENYATGLTAFFPSSGDAIRMVHNNAFLASYNTANDTRTGYLQFNTTGTSTLSVDLNQGLSFATNAIVRQIITADGNVGIGTTTPQGQLHVLTAAGAGGIYNESSVAYSANSGAFIRLYNAGIPTDAAQRLGGVLFGSHPSDTTFRTGAQIEAVSTDAWTDGINHPTDIKFMTTSSTSVIERMRLTSSGNLGIGVTTPSAKLDINGQIKISGGNPLAGTTLTSDATGLAVWTYGPKTLQSFYTTVSNDATPGGNNLMPFTVPATFLDTVGDKVVVEYGGSLPASAVLRQVGLNIGGNKTFNINNDTETGGWNIRATIIRVNDTTVRVIGTITSDQYAGAHWGTASMSFQYTVPSIAANGLLVSPYGGSGGGTANVVTATVGYVVYYPA